MNKKKMLRRARPGVIIGTRQHPAHKGIARNEMADEWTKMEAGEPDTREVEWLNYSDRTCQTYSSFDR